MFGFLHIGKDNPDVQEYAHLIADATVQCRLDDGLISRLNQYQKAKKLSIQQLQWAQEAALDMIWQQLCQGDLMDDAHRKSFLTFLLICKRLHKETIQNYIYESQIQNILYNIRHKQQLPVYDKSLIRMLFKDDEILHFCGPASLVKKVKKVTRVRYGGPVYSFRICRGVYYRVGSMKVGKETQEYWNAEDDGKFWITDQRIGFLGCSKHFSFDLSKLDAITSGEGGIQIFKSGRDNPYVVSLPSYDIPCQVLSCLLNRRDR